jgi:hypothetical protein
LNTQEGSGSSGGTRRERYRNALGSARERGLVSMLLWLSGTWIRLDHVRAVLAKMT